MTYGTKSTENRRKKHIRPGNDLWIGKLGLVGPRNLMTELLQLAGPVLTATTGFHRNEAGCPIYEVLEKLRPLEAQVLLFAGLLVDPVELEGELRTSTPTIALLLFISDPAVCRGSGCFSLGHHDAVGPRGSA